MAAVGLVYYLFVYRAAHSHPIGVAYARADRLEVVDTPAEVHQTLATLKKAERVDVLGRTRLWAQVRLADGTRGWVEARNLLDPQAFEASRRIFAECAPLPTQAAGHFMNKANLHLEPAREAAQIAQFGARQPVEILSRRLVDRGTGSENRKAGPVVADREAWYLVRSGDDAGWVLGRSVELDIPSGIAMYAQATNLVAWLELNRVADGGRQVPQYLVADRVGTQEPDFNHVRVFTWSASRHHYATAYVESNLNGSFPIRVGLENGAPSFRLRLVDARGHKIQKVYRLLNTVTRPLGTVEGWENNALPAGAKAGHELPQKE